MDKKLIGLMDQKEGWTDGKKKRVGPMDKKKDWWTDGQERGLD